LAGGCSAAFDEAFAGRSSAEPAFYLEHLKWQCKNPSHGDSLEIVQRLTL
jgi:hypothetical protein